MNIKRKDKHPTKFRDLAIGDVFEAYGDIYLKVNFAGEQNNALYLKENFLYVFDANDVVIKRQAELSVW